MKIPEDEASLGVYIINENQKSSEKLIENKKNGGPARGCLQTIQELLHHLY